MIRNNISWFNVPGYPPVSEEQARFMRTCSPGARVSTLHRRDAPALFASLREDLGFGPMHEDCDCISCRPWTT